jgi:REP element-mobilizing transposase RayT
LKLKAPRWLVGQGFTLTESERHREAMRFYRFRDDNRPFFVTTPTLDRRPVFSDADNANLFKDILYSTRERYNFKLLSFVIMPDHLHAILVPGPRNDISDVMRYIKGAHARRHNIAQGTSGPVWQDSFRDHGIRNEDSLWHLIDYVEENPVAAGITSARSEYPYSSAHPSCPTDLAAYLGQGESLTHDSL